MIPLDKIQNICSEYDVGSYVSLEKIPEGMLNDNYILVTTTGKYFIKSVREKAKEKLKMIHGVESLMKEAGIPAVVMLKTKSVDIYIEDGDEVYTLYPFIEAEKSSNYSGDDYRIMGEMLGRIHTVGSSKIPDDLGLKQFKRPATETILERLRTYKENIIGKSNVDDIDKLFLEYIDFKLITVSKIKEVALDNNALIHGDYHPGNLLLDKNTREIIGVCDWEKAEFGPTSYELARSLLYSCFYDGYRLEGALTDLKLFLQGYLSVFPMSVDEIMSGLNMRIYRMALSSWIEEKYYKENDTRANHFIEHEMDLVDKSVNGELLEQIRNLLT